MVYTGQLPQATNCDCLMHGISGCTCTYSYNTSNSLYTMLVHVVAVRNEVSPTGNSKQIE